MDTGVELIAAERARQMSDKGYTAAHDDEHDDGVLALAAACYAASAAGERLYRQDVYAAVVSFSDPFPERWDDARPYDGNVLREATPAEAKRLLVKAGALIAAEIDRLIRADAQVGRKE